MLPRQNIFVQKSMMLSLIITIIKSSTAKYFYGKTLQWFRLFCFFPCKYFNIFSCSFKFYSHTMYMVYKYKTRGNTHIKLVTLKYVWSRYMWRWSFTGCNVIARWTSRLLRRPVYAAAPLPLWCRIVCIWNYMKLYFSNYFNSLMCVGRPATRWSDNLILVAGTR